jgi:hypothetical protein
MGVNSSALRKKNKTKDENKLSQKQMNMDEYFTIIPSHNEEHARRDERHFTMKALWDGTNFSAPIEERLKNEDRFSVLEIG